MRPLFIPVLALFLTACAGLTPQGLMQAMQFDPLTTDPAVIEVAAALDQEVTLAPDGLRIAITFVDEQTGMPLVSESVALDVTEVLSLSGNITADPDQRLWRARFSDAAATRFAAAQTEIIALRAEGIDGLGSLSIMVEGGCTVGTFPEQLQFRSWLRMNAEEGYVPFSRNANLFEVLPPSEAQGLRDQLMQDC